jgi:hypothetical protein
MQKEPPDKKTSERTAEWPFLAFVVVIFLLIAVRGLL